MSGSLVTALVEPSGLTPVQLATLLAHRSGELDGLPLLARIALRADRHVSKGAFLRTLRQARRNIRRAAYTILVLEATGYLTGPDLAHFLRAGELVQQAQSQVSDPESRRRVLAMVEAVTRALVTGSQQKPHIS
jgi:hypothetical protein